MKEVNLGINVPEKLKYELKKRSIELRKSLKDFCNEALELHLKNSKIKND